MPGTVENPRDISKYKRYPFFIEKKTLHEIICSVEEVKIIIVWVIMQNIYC